MISDLPRPKPLHDRAVGQVELDHRVEFGGVVVQQPGQRLGLRHGAREAVEDEAALGVGLVEDRAGWRRESAVLRSYRGS